MKRLPSLLVAGSRGRAMVTGLEGPPMPVKPVPDGHHTVTPYLIVEDVPGLIGFLTAAFGAEPTVPPMRGPDGTIAHAEVRVGDSRVMMGQSCPQQPARPAMLHLYVEEVDRVYRAALAAGATSVREVGDQFY